MKRELDCRELKTRELLKLKNRCDELEIKPKLAIIQVGSLDASNIYVRNKRNAAEKIGIETFLYQFSEDVTEEEILSYIVTLNQLEDVNGIFIQLPLPKQLDEKKLIDAIDPKKDVDGLTTTNMGKLASNNPGLVPCTPMGVMDILHELDYDLTGKNVTIIGRSRLVGLPLFHLLLQENATVDVCHSKTTDLKSHTKKADVLITAAGTKKNLVTEDMVKDGAIVIDVSIIRDQDGKLCGDVDYEGVYNKASYITPVPGGVGQLTVLELMKNTVKAYEMQNSRVKNTPNVKKIDKN